MMAFNSSAPQVGDDRPTIPEPICDIALYPVGYSPGSYQRRLVPEPQHSKRCDTMYNSCSSPKIVQKPTLADLLRMGTY